MTIQQANQYFAALPDGFADPAQLGALLPACLLYTSPSPRDTR